VHDDPTSIAANAVNRRGKGGGGVHNNEVPGLQEVSDIAETTVMQLIWPSDEQTDLIAREASSLRWFGGRKLRWQ